MSSIYLLAKTRVRWFLTSSAALSEEGESREIQRRVQLITVIENHTVIAQKSVTLNDLERSNGYGISGNQKVICELQKQISAQLNYS